jgi:hypothetical protein
MNMIEFAVQGTSSEPYRVTFKRTGTDISAFCTCPAGTNGQHCKHRLNILQGLDGGVVSKNIREFGTVMSWFPGSSLDAAIREMLAAEAEVERAKKAVSTAKKKVATLMLA